jgi:hypothetical protein
MRADDGVRVNRFATKRACAAVVGSCSSSQEIRAAVLADDGFGVDLLLAERTCPSVSRLGTPRRLNVGSAVLASTCIRGDGLTTLGTRGGRGVTHHRPPNLGKKHAAELRTEAAASIFCRKLEVKCVADPPRRLRESQSARITTLPSAPIARVAPDGLRWRRRPDGRGVTLLRT